MVGVVIADEWVVKLRGAKIVGARVDEKQAVIQKGIQMMVMYRLVKMSLLRHGVSKEKASYKTVPGRTRTRMMRKKMTTSTRQSMDCTEHVGLSDVVGVHKLHGRGDGNSCL